MSQSAYARHAGKSPAAITKAKKERIADAVVIKDGKVFINSDLADQLLKINTKRLDPKQMSRSGQSSTAVTIKPEESSMPTNEALAAYIQGLPEDIIPSLDESFKRRAHYQAERERVAAQRERNDVIPARDVELAQFSKARAVRDSLMQLADRLAPLVAATSDARECHRLLSEEHRIALRGLADV